MALAGQGLLQRLGKPTVCVTGSKFSSEITPDKGADGLVGSSRSALAKGRGFSQA